MKKHIYISFFLILFSQCSTITDPKEIFLNDFKGIWKITAPAALWFSSQLDPAVVVSKDDIVSVAGNGFFTVAGTSLGAPVTVVFTFIEIEINGILAVYKIVNGSKTVYAGIGFGQQDDALITPNAVDSPSLVVSSDQGLDQGTIFLIK